MQIIEGFFWHGHHDVLIEWCHNFNERAKFIRNTKPASEQEVRLRLFRPVKGTLPQEVVEAQQAYNKAWQDLNRAHQDLDRAQRDLDKVLNRNKAEIILLHEKECPNCPWNGQTIFPE